MFVLESKRDNQKAKKPREKRTMKMNENSLC